MSRKNAGFRIDGTFDCDQTNDCPFIKHAVEKAEARVKELEAEVKSLRTFIQNEGLGGAWHSQQEKSDE